MGMEKESYGKDKDDCDNDNHGGKNEHDDNGSHYGQDKNKHHDNGNHYGQKKDHDDYGQCKDGKDDYAHNGGNGGYGGGGNGGDGGGGNGGYGGNGNDHCPYDNHPPSYADAAQVVGGSDTGAGDYSWVS
jgi:hypothetical protein